LHGGSVVAGDCAAISCGVPVAATISAVGEIDCYEFSGTAGQVVAITESSPVGQSQFGTCWRLRRPDNAIAATQCSGLLEVTLPTDGTYAIDVYDNSSGGGTGDATGTYNVGYVVVSGSPGSCAVPVACGATIADSISAPAENDTYAFSAQAGEIASVAANDDTGGGVAIGFELYSPSGTPLAQSSAEARTVVLPSKFCLSLCLELLCFFL
jgi:hypothetical protein